MQPGKDGTYTVYPPSSLSSNTILNFIISPILLFDEQYITNIYGVAVEMMIGGGKGVDVSVRIASSVGVKVGREVGVGVSVAKITYSPVINNCQAISKSPDATTGKAGRLPSARSKRAITCESTSSPVSVCNSKSRSRADCTS